MKYKIIFILILFLAVFTRIYQLGSFPAGLTWDEAAIGYNAYGIATVHRDEWLNRTPISFKSFGDYKSPLAIYLVSILMLFAKPTPLLVRLPTALSGVGLVVVSYFLAKEIFKDEKSKQQKSLVEIASLGVMGLVATSPWAIDFSRIGFESMIATFLISLSVLFFLYARKKSFFLLPSAVFAALSIYAYHSPKLVLPLYLLLLTVTFRTQIFRNLKWVMISIGIGLLVLAPFAYASIKGNANGRALSTTIFSQHLSPVALAGTFISHYLVHVSPSYLLFGQDITYRQSTQKLGILSIPEAALILVTVVFCIRNPRLRKQYGWLLAFYFISILPAALGVDVPHANRALLGLPWVQLFAGVAIMEIGKMLSVKNKRLQIVALAALVVVVLGSFSFFIKTYIDVYSSSVALRDLPYGYEQVIAYARSHESEVKTVYFTNTYGQAYIYLLFFKAITPFEYQYGGLANYFITDNPWKDAQGKTNILVVGTPEQIPDSAHIVYEVKYPDNVVAFRVAQM